MASSRADYHCGSGVDCGVQWERGVEVQQRSDGSAVDGYAFGYVCGFHSVPCEQEFDAFHTLNPSVIKQCKSVLVFCCT